MGYKVMYCFLFLFVLSTLSAKALNAPKDFGCYGGTFPIAETSLLQIITAKLKGLESSGELAKHQEVIRRRISHKVMNPDPVAGVRHTTQPRTFTYDPTFVLPEDVLDSDGNILYKAGTSFNPLRDTSPHLLIKQLALTKPLLFVDGDAHLSWVGEQLKQHPKAKVILVKGSPSTCSETLQHPVYFDQGGFLCQKLHLTQVPAKVTQVNDHLLIEESRFEELPLEESRLEEVTPS